MNSSLKKWHASKKPWLVAVLFPSNFPDPSAASWLRSRVLFWCQDRVVFRFDSTAEGPGHRNNVRKRPFGNQRSLVFCLVGFFQLPGSVATTVYLGVL